MTSLEEKVLNILKKENKPMTTEQIQKKSFLLKQEYCIDSIVPTLNNLASKNLIDKEFSKEKKTYVWSIRHG